MDYKKINEEFAGIITQEKIIEEPDKFINAFIKLGKEFEINDNIYATCLRI